MEQSQYIHSTLPWVHPLEFAGAVADAKFVLLYSGARAEHSGRYSYLATDLRAEIIADDFSEFEAALSQGAQKISNAWFGYLGYGLKNSLENLASDVDGWLKLPNLWMMNFAKIYEFDHELKVVNFWCHPIGCCHPHAVGDLDLSEDSRLRGNDRVGKITSNMSHGEYLQKVEKIIEKINAGELYQANLTRKFYGEFERATDQFALFKRLCEISPAPFSAFIKLGETAIISSSPELFLNIDAGGKVQTRPIKGTVKRGKTADEDKILRENLQNSEKDRAENLMIVDLMRNDLAKTCEAGSVITEKLFEVTTHATIHHLSSTIIGKKSAGCSSLEVIKSAFPAGSMTGAPKIRAMELCSELESDARGVYSGAIGWFSGDGACDLSVVIRTLIVRGAKFEFQVGGGIVADSTPAAELRETKAKARGMLLALGLNEAEIEQLFLIE
jgi:aminodeoxychorismate synthase component I